MKLNRKNTALISILCLITSSIEAQNVWNRTYGSTHHDIARSVIETSDQNYLVVGDGRPTGVGYTSYWLVKTNYLGDTLWTRSYDGNEADDYANAVIETSDESYLIVGSTETFLGDPRDIWLVKTDFQGDTLWTRKYGSGGTDGGTSVIETSDGAYLICGYTYGYGSGNPDYLLVKTNSQGDSLWTRAYSGGGNEYATSIIETSDEGYLISGFGDGFDSDYDCWLVKTDFQGDTLWTRSYSGESSVFSYSVIETSDEGYLIGGAAYGIQSDYDTWLFKIDIHGDILWSRTYGGYSSDFASSVIETSDQGYLIAGETSSFGSGHNDAWLIKTNLLGDTLWTRTYGESGFDYAESVIETSDQGYLIAGVTSSYSNGFYDYWLIKTDASGYTTQGPLLIDDFSRPTSIAMNVFPNPTNNSSTVAFTLYQNQNVELSVYSILGKRVFHDSLGPLDAGNHLYTWVAQSDGNDPLPAGVYILQLSLPSGLTSKKISIVK